jgi:hypothetical protein
MSCRLRFAVQICSTISNMTGLSKSLFRLVDDQGRPNLIEERFHQGGRLLSSRGVVELDIVAFSGSVLE